MESYYELMEKSDSACIKAMEFDKKGEKELANFWKNASIGFKIKARKLFVKKWD